MKNQHSFTEYVANRFYNELFCVIQEYIEDNQSTIDLSLTKVRHIESLELSDINVIFVSISDLPGMAIEFDVVLEADILARELDYHYDETDECQQWFMVHCTGDIEKKLDDFEIKNPISVYNGKNRQPKPMSDALVPIIYKDDLDKFAEDFLSRNYKKALLEPCYVDPIELAEGMGLKVKKAHITKDASIFGRCYFKDCETELYDPNTDSTYTELIPAKTILVDDEVGFLRNLGALNNTIVHECVHWDQHRKAFALAQLYDENLSNIGCEVVGGVSGNNRDAVDWMEWQANALAPRIQMPREMFKKRVDNIISETRVEMHAYDMIDIIEPVIEKIVIEYGVSRTAAKIRMVDVGYEVAIGAFNYIDGRYIKPHKARKGYLTANKTFSIDAQNAAILCHTNSFLQEAMDKGRYQFVDSHFVLNSPIYLETDINGNTQLTHYARNHMDECCLVFELSVASHIGKRYHSECFLNRDERSTVDFNVSYHDGYENSPSDKQIKKLQETIAEENRIYRSLPNDFALALEKVIEWRNEQIDKERKEHPYKEIDRITAAEIARRTGLNEATVRRAINGDNNTATNTVILICLALHLPYNISKHIIELSPHPLRLSNTDHQWYDFVLRVHYGKTVSEVKKILEIYGAAPLISPSSKTGKKSPKK